MLRVRHNGRDLHAGTPLYVSFPCSFGRRAPSPAPGGEAGLLRPVRLRLRAPHAHEVVGGGASRACGRGIEEPLDPSRSRGRGG
jgi:hypothetical protein